MDDPKEGTRQSLLYAFFKVYKSNSLVNIYFSFAATASTYTPRLVGRVESTQNCPLYNVVSHYGVYLYDSKTVSSVLLTVSGSPCKQPARKPMRNPKWLSGSQKNSSLSLYQFIYLSFIQC